ncbi:MAG: hypothetical protein EHM44_12060 [Ignavibacteriales bacterium]|nr:MAG: hypothetical protein EHM44_12060 [Ignavibacteriales bacterium]
MRYLFMVISFFVFNQFITAQTVNPDYDSTLAKQLGADDYGMKSYVFVILKTGSNATTDKAFIDSCFSGHMANIVRLVNEGKLIVAGPLGMNDNAYRGLFVFNVSTIEEARELVQSDPAINSKLLDADLYNWYGSAALPEYLEAALKIGKYKIN